MKKVSLLLMFFLVSVFLVSFSGKVDNLEVELDKNYLVIKGEKSYTIELTNSNLFKLKDDDLVDDSIIYLERGVYLCIGQTSIKSKYILELLDINISYTVVYYVGEDIYKYVSSLCQLIDKNSNLGNELITYRWQFSEIHYSNSVDHSISTMSMERNNRTIGEMTSIDMYLDGYKPMFIEHGYKITYNDPIINIIPESWLFSTGYNFYVGQEYAVVKKTLYVDEISRFGGPYYKTNISVFDIEVALPNKIDIDWNVYLENEAYKNSKNLKVNISPRYHNTYASIRKSTMSNLDIWYDNYDVSEDEITICLNFDAPEVFYIAPDVVSFTINNNIDDNNTVSGEEKKLDVYGISSIKYAMNFENITLDDYLSDGAMKSFIYDTVISLADSFDKTKITSSMLSVVKDFIDNKEEAEYNTKLYELENSNKEYFLDVETDPDDGKKFLFDNITLDTSALLENNATTEIDFEKIFKNDLLKDYFYEFELEFAEKFYLENGKDLEKYLYDIYIVGNMNFYYSSGGICDSKTFTLSYENVKACLLGDGYYNGDVTLQKDKYPLPYEVSTTKSFTVSTDLCKKNIGIYFKTTFSGEPKIFNISAYSTSYTYYGLTLTVYDVYGHAKAMFDFSDGKGVEGVVKLEPNAKYYIIINSKASIDGVQVSMTARNNSYSNISSNTTLYASASDTNNSTFYNLNLAIIGLYRFSTSENFDTDFKLYDSNANLILEADNSEDSWNFNTVYYNKNDKKVIAQIITHGSGSYYVDVSYFNKWSGQS